MSRKKQELIGKKFNKLLIIGYLGSKQFKYHKKRLWLCICDCGNFTEKTTDNIKNYSTLSCGCKTGRPGEGLGYAKNTILNDYKQRSKKKKHKFSLTKEEFYIFIEKPCYYCGIKFSITKKKKYGVYKCNGLDRIDNSKGYEKDNVLPCCRKCNSIRMDYLTIDETKKIIDLLKKLRNTFGSPWE